MSVVYNLFSIPVWKTKIQQTEYDKDRIVNEILHNFSIDPKRNQWDTNSVWHHSLNDDSNPKFKRISYEESGFLNIVNLKIKEFILSLNLKNNVTWKYQITNYTVSEHGYFMDSHDHPDSEFACVFYLKYDKYEHPATQFINPNCSSQYLPLLHKKLCNSLHTNNINYGYFFKTWQINTEENDFIIFPGHAMHKVPLIGKTSTPRITISINLQILNNESN